MNDYLNINYVHEFEYKKYTIKRDEFGRFFVTLGHRGMLYCSKLDEAKSFIDYVTANNKQGFFDYGWEYGYNR